MKSYTARTLALAAASVLFFPFNPYLGLLIAFVAMATWSKPDLDILRPSNSTVNVGSAVFVALLCLGLLVPGAHAQFSSAPPEGAGGLANAAKKAIDTWYWFLYLFAPVAMYMAWKKYKEGDEKGFWGYVVGTIGIFASPGLPALFRVIKDAASSGS